MHLAEPSMNILANKFVGDENFWLIFYISFIKLLNYYLHIYSILCTILSKLRPPVHKNTYAPLILKVSDNFFLGGQNTFLAISWGFYQELLTFLAPKWPLSLLGTILRGQKSLELLKKAPRNGQKSVLPA